MMCNWLQHFRNELTTQVSMSSNFTKEILPTIVTSAMPTIISNLALCDEGFTRLTIKDDGLLDMLVKIWFSSEVFLLHPLLLAGHRYPMLRSFEQEPYNSGHTRRKWDAGWLRWFKISSTKREMTLAWVTKENFLNNYEILQKRTRNAVRSLSSRLEIILFLIDERLGNDTATKFMDSLLLAATFIRL